MSSSPFDENPMAPLVTELVLGHLPPKHLLNCRLVNHAWNRSAVHLLNGTGAGWRVRLDGTNFEEYLQLLKARERSATATLVTFPIKLNVWAGTEKQACTLSRHFLCPPCTSLSFLITVSGNEFYLLKLLKAHASTLRHLQVTVFYFPIKNPLALRRRINRRLNRIRTKLSGSFSVAHGLAFQLPALRALTVAHGRCEIPGLAQSIALAAPHLQNFQLLHGSFRAVPPDPELPGTTLIGLHHRDSSKLSQLLKLQIQVQYRDGLQLLNSHCLTFTRLERLRMICFDLGLLIPLMKFIRKNCPALDWLEIEAEKNPKTLILVIVEELISYCEELTSTHTDGVQRSIGPLSLPGLVHFGFYTDTISSYDYPPCRPPVPVGLLLVFMRTFPSMERIRTDVQTFLKQLVPWDEEQDGGGSEEEDLDEERRKRNYLSQHTWPNVKEVNLAVQCDDLIFRGPDTFVLEWRVSHVISQLYPNMEKLVLTVNNPMLSVPKRIAEYYQNLTTIAYAHELRSLKHLEINDNADADEWKFTTFLRTTLVKGETLDLDVITIRSLKKSENDAIRTNNSNMVTLSHLLELFAVAEPQTQAHSNLLIRIDADLLADSQKACVESERTLGRAGNLRLELI